MSAIIIRMSTHHKSRSPVYTTWSAIHQRCYNPDATGYRYYGGLGIKVCPKWHKFENFYKDMGDRPIGTTIGRKDVNKDFEPGNCRWATKRQQLEDRRLRGIVKFEESMLIPPRRRQYISGEVTRVNVYVDLAFLKDFKIFRREVKKFCGQKVSLAYLFREGSRQMMAQLRVQMEKAKNGVLHAKKRNGILS